MGNWNNSNASGDPSEESTVDFSGGSTSSTSTSSSTDNGNDSNDSFFSGTFDDPGEAGFSGPSYPGQTGYDSDGDFYSASDVGASTSDVGWSVRGFEPVGTPDVYGAVSDYYGSLMGGGFLGTPGVDGPLPGLGGGGYRTFRTDDRTATGIPVTDTSMTRAQRELGYSRDAYKQEEYGYTLPEEMQSSTKTAFRGPFVEAEAYYDYMTGLKGPGLEPIGPYTERPTEGVAGFFGNIANFVGTKVGTPYGEDFVIDVKNRAVGQVVDDYSLRDLVVNGVTFFTGLPVSNVDTAKNVQIAGANVGQERIYTGASALGMQFGENITEEEFNARGTDGSGGEGSVTQDILDRVLPSGVRSTSRVLQNFMKDAYASPTSQIYTPSMSEADPFSQLGVSPEPRQGYAMGSVVEGQAPADNVVDSPMGFVGGQPEATPDGLTVRDDVPVDVDEQTFVINAAAVEIAGSQDIKDMLVEAIEEAKRQGIDIAQNISKIDTEREMSLLVSRGEVLIPPQIAKIIGYDRLEKINRRGLVETERRVAEYGQSPEAESLDEQPQNPAEGTVVAAGGGVTVQGSGSAGPDQKNVNLEAEIQGEGFIAKPRVNYDEQKNTREFPDGVVVDEQGKNIGFALEGQMFLSDDKSLRAGVEKQKSNFKGSAKLPAEYGGETIEFGGGSKMKRYNMGATFGPVDVDLSKTQVPNGDDVIGGSVRYRFSENGDVTLEATDDGRSGRIGLNYRF